ncbi:MAG: YhjD/YihY/BrkB family envelope integrity protein [Frankiaceae bacterium]
MVDQTGAQAAADPEPEPSLVPGAQAHDGGGFVRRQRASVQARMHAGEVRYRDLAERRPALGLPFPFLAAYQRLNLALLAGSIAFRLFMWLLPFALLVAGLLGLVITQTNWNITTAVQTAGVSGAASQQVAEGLRASRQSWWIAVLVAVALLLWTGRSLSRALTMMHAHVWEMPVPRQSQWRRTLNGAMLFAAFLVVLVASALASRIHVLTWLLGSVAMTVLTAAVWLFVSRRMPNRAVTWTGLLPGALAVGIGLAALNTVSTVYLPSKIQRASEMYGTLGIAGAILLWLFIIGQLLVCSTLLNAVWTDSAHPRTVPLPGGQAGAGVSVDDGPYHLRRSSPPP